MVRRKTIAIFAVFFLTNNLGCYSTKQYRGDGQISHPNSFWWPKYSVSFEEIDLSQGGHYSFEFSGAPPGEAIFSFQTQIQESAWRSLAAKTGLRLRTRLEDDDGNVLFDESGDLARTFDRVDATGWVISDPPPNNAIYRPEMTYLRLSPSHSYRWQIWITATTGGESVTVIPQLQSGGHLAL